MRVPASLSNTPTPPDPGEIPTCRSATEWLDDERLVEKWVASPVTVLRRMRREIAVAVRHRCAEIADPVTARAIRAIDLEDLIP